MLSRESALEKSNGCKTCAIECSVFASYCSQTHVNCGGIKDCDIRIKKSKTQSAYLRLFVERRGKFLATLQSVRYYKITQHYYQYH